MKPKTCKHCQEEYQPRAPLQVVCSLPCSMAYTETKKQAKILKDFNRETAKRREAIRPKKWYADKAQTAFNSFIRERDWGQPCISCSAPHNPHKGGRIRNCSHYRSRAAASQLRYNLYNCSMSCSQCNKDLSGNILGYREGLKRKFSRDKLDMLENSHQKAEYSIEYLERLTKIFRKRTKLYKRLREEREALNR